jgi:hypothetical protein
MFSPSAGRRFIGAALFPRSGTKADYRTKVRYRWFRQGAWPSHLLQHHCRKPSVNSQEILHPPCRPASAGASNCAVGPRPSVRSISLGMLPSGLGTAKPNIAGDPWAPNGARPSDRKITVIRSRLLYCSIGPCAVRSSAPIPVPCS